jgi:uncharacterized membrane protein
MKHVVFAVFGDKRNADVAIASLGDMDSSLREHISVIVHRDVANVAALDELVQHAERPDETDATHGRILGASLGAATGAMLGALFAGPLGLLGGGPIAGLVFGAATGTLHGALAGGLVGAGLPDHTLRHLADRIQAGDVLVTVQTPDRATEERVMTLLRAKGALVAEKHL